MPCTIGSHRSASVGGCGRDDRGWPAGGVAGDLGDANLRFAQLGPDVQNLVHGHRRPEHGFQYAVLGILDAPCQGDLALAGQERDRHHPAQVHTDRVVRVARLVGFLVGRGGYFRRGRGGFSGCSGFFFLIFFEIWSKRAH